MTKTGFLFLRLWKPDVASRKAEIALFHQGYRISQRHIS